MAWSTPAVPAGFGGVLVPLALVIVGTLIGVPDGPPVPQREPAARVRAVASVPRPASSSTMTSVPAPPPPTPPPTVAAPAVPLPGAPVPSLPAAVVADAWSCSTALDYLAGHQAPGFVDRCAPGSALGHYGYTCWNTAPYCPNGGRVIHIACPAPFVYMNEAHNSWALTGSRSGIDPYGEGNAAEQNACNRLR